MHFIANERGTEIVARVLEKQIFFHERRTVIGLAGTSQTVFPSLIKVPITGSIEPHPLLWIV